MNAFRHSTSGWRVAVVVGVFVAAAPSAHADLRSARTARDNGDRATAIRLYEEVLAQEPRNRDARLELGRVLTWGQRHAEGLRHFEEILNQDPKDVDALLGKSGCLVALGAGYEARPVLEDLAAKLPQRVEPRLTLAWMDLFTNPSVAIPAVAELEQRFPNDGGVKTISRVSKVITAPRVSLAQSRSSDNADNETDGTILEGQYSARGRAEIKVNAARYKMEGPRSPDADVSTAEASILFDLDHGHKIRLRGGLESQEAAGSSRTVPLYGASWQFGSSSRTSGRVGADREAVRYSGSLVAEEINVDRGTAGIEHRLSRAVTLRLDGQVGRVSSRTGSANRYGGSLTLERRFTAGRLPIHLGYNFGLLDHSRDLRNGYWMPLDQTSHSASARTSVYLPSGFGFFATAQLGRSNYTIGTGPTARKVTGSVSLHALAALSIPVGKTGLAVEVLGMRSEGGLEQSNGYDATTFGGRLVWRGGPR